MKQLAKAALVTMVGMLCGGVGSAVAFPVATPGFSKMHLPEDQKSRVQPSNAAKLGDRAPLVVKIGNRPRLFDGYFLCDTQDAPFNAAMKRKTDRSKLEF